MNPANESQKRTVFIGGPPRVGKTLIAHEIAKRVGGHITSTDWIREAVKRSHPERQGGLFIFDDLSSMTDEEFLALYSDSNALIERFSKQANALWPSVVAFCSDFCDDDFIHIVEGVALMPRQIAMMEYPPEKVVFVGNSDATHVESVLGYAREHSNTDWMEALGYSDAKKRAVAQATVAISEYFRDEAQKYNFKFIDLADFEVTSKALVEELSSL